MENNFELRSASVSDRGLSEKRPQNEDSFLELPDRHIFAVADGVGGAQAGEIASQMAVEILGEAFANMSESADPEQVMQDAIIKANEAIFQMSSELTQLAQMATTVVALNISGNIATVAHVGDSRLYRLDNRGQLRQETEDHSVVAEEVRAGRMTAEQAANHPSKNIISRALGAEPSVEVDVRAIMFEPETTFLLCSDGITRHVEDSEISDLLSNGHSPDEVCQRLKDLCYERGAEDNLTAVVIRVEPSAAGATDDHWPPYVDEKEEVTIATSREPIVQESDVVEAAVTLDPPPAFDAVELVNNERAAAEVGLVEETELGEYQPDSAVPTFHIPASIEPSVTTAYPKFGSKLEETDASQATPSFNIVSSLLLLLLGAALGFGGSYLWQQANPPQPQMIPVLQEKTTSQPLTAFEETRRIVDKDPAGYIRANAASPQDAADYYFLGRAFLLSGKMWEAKRSFEEAKTKLAEADAENAKTLASEISMGIAIATSVTGPSILEKELGATNTAGAAPNTNIATNSAQPIR